MPTHRTRVMALPIVAERTLARPTVPVHGPGPCGGHAPHARDCRHCRPVLVAEWPVGATSGCCTDLGQSRDGNDHSCSYPDRVPALRRRSLGAGGAPARSGYRRSGHLRCELDPRPGCGGIPGLSGLAGLHGGTAVERPGAESLPPEHLRSAARPVLHVESLARLPLPARADGAVHPQARQRRQQQGRRHAERRSVVHAGRDPRL